MLNFNIAVPFPSGACGSLGCNSVASPPRGRPWRLSPLVVLRGISMIVLAVLCRFFLNANNCSRTLYYYVLLILPLLLYRIFIPFLFITAFSGNMGRAFIRHIAAAKAQVLLRRTVVRSSVIFQREPKTLHQAKPGTKSPARFISTSDADRPPQKCIKARSRLLSSKLSENLTLWA